MGRSSYNLAALPSAMLFALVVGCAGCPSVAPGTPVMPQPSRSRHLYKVFLIPLYQELGVPPSVDQVEERACYRFSISSPAIDNLFRVATETVPLETVTPRVIRDPRIKLIREASRAALVINADLRVIAVDAMHIYKVPSSVVKQAVAVILAAARPVKAKHDACFPPEQPKDFGQGAPSTCP